MEQIMGQLGPLMVTEPRPFLTYEIYCCGPFKIHYKIRGKKPHTAAKPLLAALRRYISHREKCPALPCNSGFCWSQK